MILWCLTDKMIDLLELMKKRKDVSSKYSLEININKTKFMVISRETGGRFGLTINNTPIDRVAQFTYQGTMINDNWDHPQKIRYCRIEKTRAAFNQKPKLFKSHDSSDALFS